MRRKCLAFTFFIILLLVILDSFGIPLVREQLTFLRGESHLLMGKVVSIVSKDEAYELEVLLQAYDGKLLERKRREKILLKCKTMPMKPWDVLNQVIQFETQLEQPSGQRNPNCFDYSLYLKSKKIFHTGNLGAFTVIPSKLSWTEKIENDLIQKRFQFESQLAQPEKGLIAGLLFGETDYLTEETYEAFKKNGTAHILAVSGLHIGILYSAYKKFVGNRKCYFAIFLLVFLMLAYGTISMWTPSVVRASAMIGLRLFAQIFDLRYDLLTALSTVALLLIWQNPYVIMGAGFQMSFLAILSICFFKPVLPRKIPEFLKTVIAVNGGLLLYQMYQFNYVSLVSVLANIPIVYLTGILVPVSLAGFAFFMLAGNLPVIDLLMQSLSFLLLKINSWSTLGGYGAVEVISPSLWFVIGFYFICFFTVSEYGLILWLRKKKKLFFYWILFALLLSVILAGFHYHPAENADLVFIDVGQGDSLHIRSKNKNLLIDGGGSINYNVGQKILKPYLLKNGVSKIDLALATHLHTDHYKGLTELSASFPVKKLETGLTKGRKFKVSSDVIVETLWPIVIEGEKGQEENAQCSVFMIEYNGWKILVTGDLDEDGERKMVEHYKGTDKLSADILKIGHHGSRSSTCDVFLEMVNPSIAVIQVGANNIYGHPDRKVIEKCQKKGIMIVRNDKNGAIGFSFHKKEIKIYPIISYP